MPDIQAHSRYPQLGVSTLVLYEENLLLVKRGKQPAKGLWSLPGGRVEWGETLQEAARREVKEETGLLVENLTFAEFVDVIRSDHHFVIAVFAARLAGTSPLKAGDDASDAQWVSFSAMDALNAQSLMTPGTAARVHRLSTIF